MRGFGLSASRCSPADLGRVSIPAAGPARLACLCGAAKRCLAMSTRTQLGQTRSTALVLAPLRGVTAQLMAARAAVEVMAAAVEVMAAGGGGMAAAGGEGIEWAGEVMV